MSSINKDSVLYAAQKRAEEGNNQLWIDYHSREELKLKQQQISLEFHAMKPGPQKKELGVKIDAINREISAYTLKIKEGGKDVTSMFRGVAGMILPKHIYSQVLHEVNQQINFSGYEPKLINVLTSEEEEYIIKGKAYDTDVKSLRDKISMAKRRINELMPNFLGALDKDEYDARLVRAKELKSILKELL